MYNTDAGQGPRRRMGIKTKVAAGLIAAALVGGGAAFAVEHSSSSSAAIAPGGTSAAGGVGTAPSGTGATGASGITPTQYRLSGTVTAIGSNTVTVKSAAGATKTYTVSSATKLMSNGASVALSSFKVGDSVVGSVTSSGGSVLNDLLVGMAGGAPTGS
jgi:putative serine protease PepD